MMRPHQFILVMALMDGGRLFSCLNQSGADGRVVPPAGVVGTDGGDGAPQLRDGGTGTLPPHTAEMDGGTAARPSLVVDGIEWPEEVRPLATLDGPAVLAAHAALQHLLESFPREDEKDCSHSAKAMEVIVGEHRGLYFVQINQRVEKCGKFAPGFNLTPDWFELYAVSPDGKVLARYPYSP